MAWCKTDNFSISRRTSGKTSCPVIDSLDIIGEQLPDDVSSNPLLLDREASCTVLQHRDVVAPCLTNQLLYTLACNHCAGMESVRKTV